jgi:predicted nucleotidyltransferase
VNGTVQQSPALNEVRAKLRALLPGLRNRYPIAYLGVFGSWVRGEQDADSDLDILVDFDGPIGWEIVALEQELSRELGVRVDLVPRQGLKPFTGRRILDEVVPV